MSVDFLARLSSFSTFALPPVLLWLVFFSHSFPCRLTSNDWSLAAQWAQLLITSFCWKPNTGKIYTNSKIINLKNILQVYVLNYKELLTYFFYPLKDDSVLTSFPKSSFYVVANGNRKYPIKSEPFNCRRLTLRSKNAVILQGTTAATQANMF